MLQRFSAGQRLMLGACTVILAVYIIINTISLRHLYNYSKQEAKNTAVLTSKYNSKNVERNFEKVLTIANDFANQAETMVEQDMASRELLIQTMENALEIHDNLFGIAIMYEPSAFDNRDTSYKNHIGSNQNGQFMPYVTRGGFSDYVIELCYYENYTSTQTMWYDIPRDTGNIYLTEPTTYPVHGKNQTVASVVVPIVRDGNFVGVVSLDTSLDYLQKESESVKPMGGFSEIISAEGIYVAHGLNPDYIMKSARREESWIEIIEEASTGREITAALYSSDMDEKVLAVFSPIHLEGTDQYWTYASIIPESNIYEEFQNSFRMIVIIGMILIAFVIYINYYIISKDL